MGIVQRLAAMFSGNRKCSGCNHWMSVDRKRGRCDRLNALTANRSLTLSGGTQIVLDVSDQQGLSYTRPIVAADDSCTRFAPIGHDAPLREKEEIG